MSKDDNFFPLSDHEIAQILKIIDESNFDELRLEAGELKLTVGKGEGKIAHQEPRLARPRSPKPLEGRPKSALAVAPASAQVSPPLETGVTKTDLDRAAFGERDGLISVKAPTLGIFYRSPKPGAPPFVDVGTLVTETDTVCLIEVMKLFNAVKAGVRGQVVKICAENTQMVEYNQTLFLIKPEQVSPELSTQ